MNGRKAKELKKLTFEALKYDEGEISKKPTHQLHYGETNKVGIYRTPAFRKVYRARKKNYMRHVTN